MKLYTLCYVKDNGKTLMLHRVKKKNDVHDGKWNGLGGNIEPGETPEECVIREVKEESGLTISNPHLRGIMVCPLFDGAEDWYVFIFTASHFTGSLIDSDEGNLAWIEDEKIKDLSRWESDAIFWPLLTQQDFFVVKFVYQHGTLESHTINLYPRE